MLRKQPIFLLIVLILISISNAYAAGGNGQRARCVFEGSACNSGLKQIGNCAGLLGSNACKCGLFAAIGVCGNATSCGGEGQRGCCVTERIPACNSGMIAEPGCDLPGIQCACGTISINSSDICLRASPTADEKKRLKLQHQLDYQIPLSQITWVGSHNTYNAKDWDYPYPNHNKDLTDQLNAGLRAVNFDVHSYLGAEKLCHFAGDSSLTCSPADKTFAYGLQQLNTWLNDNSGEIVLLLLEDYIDNNRHSHATSEISARLGAKVYRPNLPGTCDKVPLATLTKQQILDVGKQLIITTADKCKSTHSGWRSWVWDVNQTSYKADEYKSKDLTRRSDHVHIVYEDRSIFGGGASNLLKPAEVNGAMVKGAGIIALDMALSVDRFSGAIWSWNKNEPNNVGNEDCATQIGNGYWNDVPCHLSFRYACQSLSNGSWAISSSQGGWSNGNNACRSLGNYAFSVPINASENAALKASKSSAGVGTVWLNHTDQTSEGSWVATHASTILNDLPTISLLGAHGKYAVAESNGEMNANRSAIGSWEKFKLITNNDGTVSFLSHHGKYASAQANGTLVADRGAIYSWEKFQRINHSDGKVSFRSVAHGKYIVAEADGRMNANRTAIGSWERFEMIYQSSDL